MGHKGKTDKQRARSTKRLKNIKKRIKNKKGIDK